MCFACKPGRSWLKQGWRLLILILSLSNVFLIFTEFDSILSNKHFLANEPFLAIDFSQETGVEKFLWERGKEREIEAVQTAIHHFEPKHSLQDCNSLATTIVDLAREYQIDSYLVLSIIRVESTFNREAISPKGAVGLMQIKPSVAKWIAQKSGIASIENKESLYIPELNVKLGILYFKYLMEIFDDSVVTSLEAYNIGPKVVKSHLNENKQISENKAHYARKVLQTYRMIKNEQYSIQLTSLD